MVKEKEIPTPYTVFQELQKKMLAGLTASSKAIKHPTTQGDSTEAEWLNLFQNYLPARYQAERGHVMDSQGGMSEQIDIVIFDRHFTPFLFNDKGVFYVPAESVYAVIEVKPEINKKQIEYAAKKIASVRKLHRTSVPIPYAGGTYAPKILFPILGGIVATKVDWKKGFDKEFQASLATEDVDMQIDFGCAIDTGSFVVEYDGTSIKQIEIEKDNILLTFFMKLLDSLQIKGSVPALDYKAYYRLGK